jgi:hypothetical protein
LSSRLRSREYEPDPTSSRSAEVVTSIADNQDDYSMHQGLGGVLDLDSSRQMSLTHVNQEDDDPEEDADKENREDLVHYGPGTVGGAEHLENFEEAMSRIEDHPDSDLSDHNDQHLNPSHVDDEPSASSGRSRGKARPPRKKLSATSSKNARTKVTSELDRENSMC